MNDYSSMMKTNLASNVEIICMLYLPTYPSKTEEYKEETDDFKEKVVLVHVLSHIR